MIKSSAKLFLFFIVNINIFALPGMSSVSYDFSLNKDIFSQAAINCQTRPTVDVGLERISEFMNQMNCNNISDPEKFCNCVSAISNRKGKLSEKESIEIVHVIDKVSKDKVLESMAGGIEDIENYNDLIAVLSSELETTSCFQSEGRIDNTFGELKRKQRAGETLTAKEELKERIYDKIQSDLRNSEKLPMEEVLSDASYLKFVASQVGYTPENEDKLLDTNLYDIKNIDWSKIKKSPVINLMRNDKNLSQLLTQSNKTQYKKSTLPFGRVTQTSSLNFLQGKIYDKKNIYNSNGYDVMMIDSSVRSACDNILSEINKLVEKSDIDKTVRSIKAAAFNPITDEQKETYKLLEQDISKDLGSTDDLEERRKVQEFIFNVDILYCENRENPKGKGNVSGISETLEDLRKEVKVVSTKLEMAKKDKDEDYSKFIEANELLNNHFLLVASKEKKIQLLEDILNGSLSNIDGSEISIDINNQLVFNLAKEVSPSLYVLIENARKQSTDVKFTKSELTTAISAEKQELEFLKVRGEMIGDKFIKTDQVYRNSLAVVRELEKDKKLVMSKIESRVGTTEALVLVASTEQIVEEELGIKSSYDLVFENEKRKNDGFSGKKSRSKRLSNKVLEIATSINNSVIEPTSTDPSVISSISTDTADSSTKQEAEVTSVVKSQSESTVPAAIGNIFTNNSMVQPVAKTHYRKQVDTISNAPKESKANYELESKIKELEELIAAKDKADESVESDSIDTKIADLKAKIDIEKIRAEKLKVTSELNNLRNSSGAVKPVDSNVAQNNSTFTPITIGSGTRNSRSPSSAVKSSNSGASNLSSGGNSNYATSSVSSVSSEQSSAPAPSRTLTDSQNVGSLDNNLDKSKLLTLDGIQGSENTLSSGIEIRSFQGELLDTDTRLVKVDFNLTSENAENQQEALESLFADGEEEIIILTLEGKKMIVKHKELKSNKSDKEKEKTNSKQRKMRHQNLIDLLKVGQTEAPL